MNKRISTLTLFVVGTLLLGLVGAIAALAAPSSAVTGTVAFDQAWYTTGAGTGSVVTVSVTDADANLTVATSTAISLSFTGALDTDSATLPTGTGEIVGIPGILLSDTCDTSPVFDATTSVSVFNAPAGTVVVT
ncbi:MAG: hypothetical protein O7D33_07925, partial [Chloroflexi bacterium]|nr:hypothetical protein [Chloroflexota bacterium]